MECVTSFLLMWAVVTLMEHYLCGTNWLVAIFFGGLVTLLTPVFGIGLVLWVWHVLRDCA